MCKEQMGPRHFFGGVFLLVLKMAHAQRWWTCLNGPEVDHASVTVSRALWWKHLKRLLMRLFSIDAENLE